MNFVPPSDPILWRPSAPVTDIVAEVHPHIEAMRALLAKTDCGVAIAAPQVGIPLRFFYTSGRFLPSVVINPVIIDRTSRLSIASEGCLTWPQKCRSVERAAVIRVQFLNFHGVEREDVFGGLAARIFQHENDHLDGICIFEKP